MDLLKLLPQQDKLSPPKVMFEGHRDHGKQMCYNFVTTGKGCKSARKEKCHFAHIGINNEEDRALPKEFFRSLQKILICPVVSPHYRQTHEFVSFLATIG